MSDSNNDMNHAVLNLSAEEKRVFAFLFDKADVDQIGVVTGERAVAFFERTGVQPQVLGEIWQLADTENRGFLSRPGFCIVLRLIGHYQAGREPNSELAFKSGPLPKFDGLQIPGPPPPAATPASPTQTAFATSALQPQTSGQGAIRIPPLDPQKVAQYSGLFERSGAQNGLLNGLTAKAIFERAGLPVETLGKIWTLADREQRGALDQTEFIVAMHLLTSTKSRAMTVLPNTLPQGFYDAAARRGVIPPPPQARQQPTAIPRQFTGNSIGAPVRTSSPLARPTGLATPPPGAVGPAWLVTAAEKAKYDQFFANIDTQGRGVLSGEQAVTFFGDSGLPEDTLASIWDLADINSEGQLNKDEFAVAMFLIRQQRTSSAAPLPAFLPAALIPPSMRKPNLQQQTQQTTAPAFETAASKPQALPKSAADDLFGLDEPIQPTTQASLAPQTQKTRDPFNSSTPASPVSAPRLQPQQSGSVFKPFMPTSAFGATLASQNTGSSQSRAVPQPSAVDDLLGNDDAHAEESSKLTNETTELANMSNQIGNLRTQMEETQTKKSATQTELSSTSSQKRDLETRLQQFRAQYEQEVRTVKDLEQQLVQSRDSTKKLGQELALLEGAHQDLQTQHQSTSQALQADQAENTNLKQQINQLNTEIAALKPEIEKMKLDARQQKGMVSINKKQVITNEAERDRLSHERTELQREAEVQAEAEAKAEAEASRVASPQPATKDIVSPAASTLSATNPFFRRTGAEAERSVTPATTVASPTPSAFDQLFGPSFAQAESARSPPPTTSFGNKSNPSAGLAESMSSDGKLTPAATPPLSETTRDLPIIAEPPPPPLSRQFTPDQLPVGGLAPRSDHDETTSTAVIPPASLAGDLSERESDGAITPAAVTKDLPGAFPHEDYAAEGLEAPQLSKTEADFDSAFASFGGGDEKPREAEHTGPFAAGFSQPSTQNGGGFGSAFPPVRSLELDYEDSDSEDESDRGFGDSFDASSTNGKQPIAERPNLASFQPTASELPKITAQTSPPTYDQSEGAAERSGSEVNAFPKEFTGLLPAREDPTAQSTDAIDSAAEGPATPKAVHQRQPMFPAPPRSTTSTAPTGDFQDASSRPLSEFTDADEQSSATTNVQPIAAPRNAFDEFDDFEDLSEAQEADKTGSDFDFGFGGHSRIDSDFDAAFDSPVASTADIARTNTAASGTFGSGSANGFPATSPFAAASTSVNSSIQHTPEAKHDWDAIFSGLDNSAASNPATSLSVNNIWEPSSSSASRNTTSFAPTQAGKAKDMGRAITPGTEHDDPILKRLTGMGYARSDALDALEMFDYDINKAVEHLSSNK